MNKAQIFIEAFKGMQTDVHDTANSKGWWEGRFSVLGVVATHNPERLEFARVNNQLGLLMLITTELAEAAEGLRHGNPPDDKIPTFSAAEAELADAIIRIMDMAEAYGWDVAGAIIAKAEMNKGRAHMHGGKKA